MKFLYILTSHGNSILYRYVQTNEKQSIRYRTKNGMFMGHSGKIDINIICKHKYLIKAKGKLVTKRTAVFRTKI